MKRWVWGKRVAIVGRAGSLLASGNGPAIDACDVVIRINWVLPIPPRDYPHVGTRTELVVHCKRAGVARRTAEKLGVATRRIRGKERRRIAEQTFNKPKRFRPTTGFCAIWQAVYSGAREVHLFGFDFFKSGHCQDREPDGDDYSKPLAWLHSPEQERKALRAFMDRHPNVYADSILREALK